MSDSNLTLDIRFDGPPGPESGHFIEAEIDGTSVGIGEWVEDGDDWLLRIPWTSPEEVELLNRRLKELIRRLEQQRVDATVCPVKATDYAIKHKLRYPEDLSCPRLDKTDDSEVQTELLAEMDRLRAELEEVRKVRRESCELCDVANKLHGPLYPSPKPGHVTSDQCGPCDDTCAYPEPGDPDCKASIAGDVKKWTDCADLREYDERVAEELTRLDTKIDRIRKRVEGIADRLTTVDVEATDEEGNLARQIVVLGKRIKRLEPSGPDCKHPRAADDKNAREHLAIKTTIGTIADALADLIKVELAKGTVFECERVLLSNALESVLRARAFLPKPAGRLSSKSIPEQVEE